MDVKAFQTEVTKHTRLLWRVSWSVLRQPDDCADAVQEALTRAWEGRDTLKNMRAFRPWLVKILLNACYDMLRRQTRQRTQPLDDETAASVPIANSLPLREALDRLTPEHRTAVVLHYLEGYSVAEIAAMLGIPAGTVKSRLLYARRQLRELLRDPMDDEREER